ncbi:GTP cyclohydrolase I FolE [Helicobacter sp. MIT 03-1616]|uniref:GTP cyclohydrolase I FolE n=1 Tax=Helicobacter sp. MIT 03-1616 TaxID=1548148 RepID=UPI00051CFCE9|nr:GTP cyclohydrolase I FolE [Helicobacter sp. MIT 03-1616]TLD88797.1 GTP cyclohydrolase I FolE [Helicobacter sp. MIT 03-1616]
MTKHTKNQSLPLQSPLLKQNTQLFFETLCQNVGENPNRDGLLRTPERIAQSFSTMLNGYSQSPKEALGSIFEENVCDEMIVLKKLHFYSMCEHHLLPFFGHISIGYIPDKKLVGISGLARLVEVFAHRLQIQENLTTQIANALDEELKPKGAMIVCEARHLCLEMRNKQPQSPVITSTLRGLFKKDSRTRAEFMQLIQH